MPRHKKTEEVVDAKIIEESSDAFGLPIEKVEELPAQTQEVPIVAQTVDEITPNIEPENVILESPPVLEIPSGIEAKEIDGNVTLSVSEQFSEPQPSVPVEVVIEPVIETVKREKAEVDKVWLFKMLYSLGTGSTWQYQNISLVNKIPDLFGMSKEDGLKKWEEIKDWYGKQ
jgi:hypothetical protein